jgi:hypothetical protein
MRLLAWFAGLPLLVAAAGLIGLVVLQTVLEHYLRLYLWGKDGMPGGTGGQPGQNKREGNDTMKATLAMEARAETEGASPSLMNMPEQPQEARPGAPKSADATSMMTEQSQEDLAAARFDIGLVLYGLEQHCYFLPSERKRLWRVAQHASWEQVELQELRNPCEGMQE